MTCVHVPPLEAAVSHCSNTSYSLRQQWLCWQRTVERQQTCMHQQQVDLSQPIKPDIMLCSMTLKLGTAEPQLNDVDLS